MEKRILGIVLSALGVIGLICAGIIFVSEPANTKNTKAIIFSGLLGALFFYACISLIKNTKDKET